MTQEEYYARMFIEKCSNIHSNCRLKRVKGVDGSGYHEERNKQDHLTESIDRINYAFGPGAYERYLELKEKYSGIKRKQ